MLLFPLPPPAMWPKNLLCLAVIGFPCIFLSCRTFRALARVGNDFFLPAIGPAYLTLGALRTGALRTGAGLRLGAIGATRLTPGVPALGDGLRLGVARLMGLGTRLRCGMIRLLYHPTFAFLVKLLFIVSFIDSLSPKILMQKGLDVSYRGTSSNIISQRGRIGSFSRWRMTTDGICHCCLL